VSSPPAGLDYDIWLGPAPFRPYNAANVHYHWRWWWDFGGGILADMACHYMDLPFWALDLRAPTTISATGQVTYKGDNAMPDRMQVEYDFPGRDGRPPVHLTWYHGVKGPDFSGRVGYVGFGSGVLFEGEKGQLLADYTHYKLLPESAFERFKPAPSLTRSLGHHNEWLAAIKRGGPTTCSFAYSGPLAEAVLLGNVAYRCGKTLAWDARAGKVTNAPEAAQYLRREYRKGWELE
jgi:predicted dehydrogenase